MYQEGSYAHSSSGTDRVIYKITNFYPLFNRNELHTKSFVSNFWCAVQYLSRQHSFEGWKNIDGTPCKPTLTADWMEAKGYKQMSAKRYEEYFNETCKEPGVYILTIGWRDGGGHATILQKFKDGKLQYIEPQSYDDMQGTKRSIDELCKSGATKPIATRGILRVDNKLFNTKFIDIFNK